MKLTLEDIEKAKQSDRAAQEKIMNFAKSLFYSIKKRRNYYFPFHNDEDVLVDLQTKMLTHFIYDFDINKVEHGNEVLDEPRAIFGFFRLAIRRYIMNEIKHQNNNRQKALATSISMDAEISNQEGSATIADILVSDAPTPEEVLLIKEETNRYLKYIERYLSDNEKNVIKAHMEGLSYDEIAQKYRMDLKQVDNCFQRAKKKLIGQNAEIPVRKNISERQCVVLKYCALPFEKRLEELKNLYGKYSEKAVIQELKKFKSEGYIAYGVGWNAERKAILTEKGKKLVKQFQITSGD